MGSDELPCNAEFGGFCFTCEFADSDGLFCADEWTDGWLSFTDVWTNGRTCCAEFVSVADWYTCSAEVIGVPEGYTCSAEVIAGIDE